MSSGKLSPATLPFLGPFRSSHLSQPAFEHCYLPFSTEKACPSLPYPGFPGNVKYHLGTCCLLLYLGKRYENLRTISYWSCLLIHDWKIFRQWSWAWFTALWSDVPEMTMKSQNSIKCQIIWRKPRLESPPGLKERSPKIWRTGCVVLLTSFKRCEILTFHFDLRRLRDLHTSSAEKKKIKFAEHCNLFYIHYCPTFNQHKLNT